MSQATLTKPVSDGAVSDETPAATKPKRPGLRRVLVPIVVVLAVAAGAVGYNLYWQGVHYVSTDNAQVAGQPVSVGSMNAGRVAAVYTSVGASVHRGDVLAHVAVPTQVRTFQNGAPDLDFLGASDDHVDVTSPMDGVVIAVPGAVGATVGQGQALVTLIDPTQLWVTANVDENQASRLRIGQEAEVHLDALNATVVGHVSELTPATASVFGLLPQANTTANFTKVAQVTPVRVAVDLQNGPGLLGSSAEVKIRVA